MITRQYIYSRWYKVADNQGRFVQSQTHTHITYTSFIVQVTTLLPCEGEYLSGGRRTLEDRRGIVGLSWCGLDSTDRLGPAGFEALDELS